MRKKILVLIAFIISLLSSCDQKCAGVVCTNGGTCLDGNCVETSQIEKGYVIVTSSTTSLYHGNFLSNGNISETEKGVCWDTDTIVDITDDKVSAGTALGNFSCNITGLTPNTTYYLRSYATNSQATSYGDLIMFNTSWFATDIDGNTYAAILIGTQVWFTENLKTSRYRNGNVIPTGHTSDIWSSLTTGAYSIYDDSPANNTTYGKLYNWYAVNDSRGICPTGWHIPTEAEWTTLIYYVGYYDDAGGMLKTIDLWNYPNTGATNSSGFSGKPGGRRDYDYEKILESGFFWSSTMSNSYFSRMMYLFYDEATTGISDYPKDWGLSCRCLKD